MSAGRAGAGKESTERLASRSSGKLPPRPCLSAFHDGKNVNWRSNSRPIVMAFNITKGCSLKTQSSSQFAVVPTVGGWRESKLWQGSPRNRAAQLNRLGGRDPVRRAGEEKLKRGSPQVYFQRYQSGASQADRDCAFVPRIRNLVAAFKPREGGSAGSDGNYPTVFA